LALKMSIEVEGEVWASRRRVSWSLPVVCQGFRAWSPGAKPSLWPNWKWSRQPLRVPAYLLFARNRRGALGQLEKRWSEARRPVATKRVVLVARALLRLRVWGQRAFLVQPAVFVRSLPFEGHFTPSLRWSKHGRGAVRGNQVRWQSPPLVKRKLYAMLEMVNCRLHHFCPIPFVFSGGNSRYSTRRPVSLKLTERLERQ